MFKYFKYLKYENKNNSLRLRVLAYFIVRY